MPHLDELGRFGQRLCVGMIPNSNHRDFSAALFCGRALPNSESKQLLIDGGLIHLMVLSGLHIFYLERMLFFASTKTRLSLLGFYCVLTGFAAPVFRTFLRRCFQPLFLERWRITNLQAEAALITLLLLLYPPWFMGRSFLMSWMAGLAVRMPLIFPKRKALERALKIYLLLVPFCGLSICGVLGGLLLAPVFGFVLFPLTVLTILCPPLVMVSDWAWRLFEVGLAYWPNVRPLFFDLDVRWLCLVPPVLHMTLLVTEVLWRRAFAFSFSRP